ncbi:MAG: hypothetical protein AAF791_02195 [Bacteroidota bacterium]
MQLPRTPFFIVWTALVAVAAFYLVIRLFLGEYGRMDYALMAFVHLSLLIQYALGWRRQTDADG